MTSRASALRSGGASHVLRVIELHIEALFELVRESLQGRIVTINVYVTDRAHGNVWGRELRQVAARAILVTRKVRARGIICAVVTA